MRTAEEYAPVGSGRKRKLDGEAARWVCNSNEVINLKLIRDEDAMFSEDDYFQPIYTNQVSSFFWHSQW
ncbi:MAG: hypothetical protein P4M11_02435 [Candidatus Pacebacteria bacterium]|nr:hypothetical protein [Candidatus Paceibacterota bacterium]